MPGGPRKQNPITAPAANRSSEAAGIAGQHQLAAAGQDMARGPAGAADGMRRFPARQHARGVAGPAPLDADQPRGRRRRRAGIARYEAQIARAIPAADAGLRAAIISAITLGITISRHLITSDELATADPAHIIELLRPCMLTTAPDHTGPPN